MFNEIMNEMKEINFEYEIIEKPNEDLENEQYDYVRIPEQKLSQAVIKSELRNCFGKISSMSDQFICLQASGLKHIKSVKQFVFILMNNQEDLSSQEKS